MSMIETYSSINNLTIYHVDLDYSFQFLIGSPDELLEENLQWIVSHVNGSIRRLIQQRRGDLAWRGGYHDERARFPEKPRSQRAGELPRLAYS